MGCSLQILLNSTRNLAGFYYSWATDVLSSGSFVLALRSHMPPNWLNSCRPYCLPIPEVDNFGIISTGVSPWIWRWKFVHASSKLFPLPLRMVPGWPCVATKPIKTLEKLVVNNDATLTCIVLRFRCINRVPLPLNYLSVYSQVNPNQHIQNWNRRTKLLR